MEPNVLQRSVLFAGLSPQEIQEALGCLAAKTTDHPQGAALLLAGAPVQAMGLLLEGSALIVQEDYWGNRNLLARVGPGQLFAEAFACSPGSPLTVSVLAESPCRVLWLNVAKVLTVCPKACAHHSRMVQGLLCDLAAKNLRFNEKICHMGKRTTREKLLSYLSAQAQRQGTGAFDIPLDRQQLADYLAVERSAMSAELSKLRREGVLEYHKNHFVLHQPAGD